MKHDRNGCVLLPSGLGSPLHLVAALNHGEETDVFADSGYRGVEKHEEAKDLQLNWHIAMMPSKRRALNLETASGQLRNAAERVKAGIRAKVEHPFRVIKCQFGFTKVRYRGLYALHRPHSCRLNFGGSRSAYPINGIWRVIMSALDFWSRHLAACQAQGVSINAYAKREGLSAVSLYYRRKRLGLAGSRPRDVVASPFVPIQVER